MPEGATLLADNGYDSNAIREAAASKNAWANIPSRSNRKQRFPFSGWVYRQRNLVERLFNRIKHFRGIVRRNHYDQCGRRRDCHMHRSSTTSLPERQSCLQ
jgi:transposase